MEPRIERLNPKKLVGIYMDMSLSDNRTADLWRQFMPRRHHIINRSSTDYISTQMYGENWDFSPDAVFRKWAAAEVLSFDDVPTGMEGFMLEGGLYAVFIHHGPANKAPETMRYIFGSWLPQSPYALDNREHFEVLPEQYNPMDPNAREEVWIPIRSTFPDA